MTKHAPHWYSIPIEIHAQNQNVVAGVYLKVILRLATSDKHKWLSCSWELPQMKPLDTTSNVGRGPNCYTQLTAHRSKLLHTAHRPQAAAEQALHMYDMYVAVLLNLKPKRKGFLGTVQHEQDRTSWLAIFCQPNFFAGLWQVFVHNCNSTLYVVRKLSRFPDELESFQIIWKVSR